MYDCKIQYTHSCFAFSSEIQVIALVDAKPPIHTAKC